MSDLIKREDAIKALQKEINKGIPPFDDTMGAIRCGVRLARNIIEDLPSADRPQGESILQDTIQRLERVIKHGVVGKDGMHPVSAEVMLNWLKGADDETD